MLMFDFFFFEKILLNNVKSCRSRLIELAKLMFIDPFFD